MWRSFARRCEPAFQELWDDLRSTGWVRGFGWLSLLVVWVVGLGSAITMVALSGPAASFGDQQSFSACLPDGSFSLQPELYNPFKASHAFEITVAFGNLSFANAKLIDVVWDIVSRPILSRQKMRGSHIGL